MHTLHARSPLARGMHMVAGMLSFFTARKALVHTSVRPPRHDFQLVSWSSGAHSRREDELARSRLLRPDQESLRGVRSASG